MTDPTSPNARQPVAATAAATPATLPPLAFTDADSAKRWAKTLPLTDVAQLYEAVRGQLQALVGRGASRRASARRSPR